MIIKHCRLMKNIFVSKYSMKLKKICFLIFDVFLVFVEHRQRTDNEFEQFIGSDGRHGVFI